MSAHARLGPSNARWVHCPGSIREEAAYPDTSSEAAIDGTGSHELLEVCLKDDRDPITGEVIGVGHSDKPEGWTVDVDRATRVQMCLDYVRSRKKELESEYPECRVLVDSETRSNPGGLYGREDWWGTVDVTISVIDTTLKYIEVVDYKDGRGWVDVRGNTQLISYIGGKMRPYVGSGPQLVAPFKWQQVDACRITIVQPKTNPAVRSADMAPSAIFDELEILSNAAFKTDAPDAPLKAGKHCQWCKHKPNCTALTEESMDIVKADLGHLAVDVGTLTHIQLADLADARKGFEEAFDRIETEIQRRIEAGEQVPGYTMAPGRNSRVWNESEDVIAKALAARRIKKDEIFPPKLISPAQLMKLPSLTEKQKKNIEAEYITNKSGALKLKQIPRDQVSSPAFKDTKDMFAAVEKPISFF